MAINPILPALAFVGKQNSGKTTLLVKLVAELDARGVRVGTIKHHSHSGFEFDVAGKDSWRHRQAGSRFTVIAAPDQIACVQEVRSGESPPLARILENMTVASVDAETGEPGLDVVLVEGYRHSGLATVELFRADNPNDAERALGVEGNRIVAVVTDMPRIVAEAREGGYEVSRNIFSFDDILLLADFVEDFIRV
ncbi:MAG: molybdopterin-guanine dinucleotide biosynthesis protein B [Coriobacteriales bacterium]|nr:molybdopterin-guanine dinucleotide biosynthesis protein B [Coriobacteriales bacterium]